MMEGGCFCKKVRYRIDDGDYLALNCHCTMCRHIHAAPFVSWLVVPAQFFRYVAGSATTLRSSERGTRYFCSSCGTHVACTNDGHPNIVDVAIGSLDDPRAVRPTREVYTDTRLESLNLRKS